MKTWLMHRRAIGLLALLLVLASVDTALAQGGRYRGFGSRYSSPYGPTMSPYLDYFRRDTGVLDPYNTFIRPRRQLQNQLSDIVQQEQAQTAKLQQQIQGIKEAQAAPTGVGASYLNYSHYYKLQSGGAQGRRK